MIVVIVVVAIGLCGPMPSALFELESVESSDESIAELERARWSPYIKWTLFGYRQSISYAEEQIEMRVEPDGQ